MAVSSQGLPPSRLLGYGYRSSTARTTVRTHDLEIVLTTNHRKSCTWYSTSPITMIGFRIDETKNLACCLLTVEQIAE